MIHVHTCVVWNTIDYAYYMLQNAADMADDPTQLRFSVYCLDKHSYEFVKSSSQFREFNIEVVPVIQAYKGQGSEQHASAVHEMMVRFSADAHNAVVDGDTVLLQTGWDNVVERELIVHAMFGVNYTNRDKAAPYRYYEGCPTLSWLVIKQGTDVSGLDVAPRKQELLDIDTLALSRLYGVPVGSRLMCDTGWQLPSFIASNELSVMGLEASMSSTVFRPETVFLEYPHMGRPFVAHMQRSIRLPFRMTQQSREFYDSCERYITQM
jgi:hypothetical protein